ncbi:MAG: hypothetical protein Q4B42_00090 [Oscillospiraceae bacterium]|nr:hypothetical protein [Oscillospiraceae bacterium]
MSFALSFVSILLIALLFIRRFKVNAALAPFASIAFITLLLIFTGVFNLLIVGIILVYALAVFSLWYCLIRERKRLAETAREFFKPGMVFFIVSSLAFLVALGDKQPYFMIWDEFSFWGIAVKNMWLNGRLYTLFTSSMIGVSYPPALPVFSYFMQCTAGVFTEWLVYLAYDILMMSVFAMLFARLKWKNYIALPVLSFTSVAALYIFWESFEGLKLYSTSYSDVPLGVVFGAVLAAWFSSDERGFPRWSVTALALLLLPMMKDTGLAFALVAAAVCAFDMIISRSFPSERLFKWEKPFVKYFYALAFFIAVLVSYEVWTLHLASAVSIERNSVPYEYGLVDMLAGRDPFFNEIWKRMVSALTELKLVTFGNVKTMLIAFTLTPLVLAPFCKHKRNSLRLVINSFMLLAGFFLYYLMMAYLYTAVFHSSEYSLTSYQRYISSYAIGWLIAILAMCFGEISRWRWVKAAKAPAVAACGVLLWSLFYYTPVPLKNYVFISEEVYQDLLPLRQLMMDNAADFAGAFTSEDRIYYVCQDSNGGEWFYFNYEFQPAFTVQTLEGGDFVAKGSEHDGPYDVEADRADFEAYLREEEVDYVFVQKIDDYFAEEFAPLFSDNLMGFFDGTASMYKITYTEMGGMSLIPVYSGVNALALKEQYGY